MKNLLVMFISTWYIWTGIILIYVLMHLMPKIKGYFGEKSVAFFLSQLDKDNYKVINDIILQAGNKTTQIDHIVVSNYGIFVIETKNYKGWIFGNENSRYWTQVIYKRKEKLYNPIKQNYGHIKALKKILSDFDNLKFYSIIVFTTKADLKVETITDVVYTVNILKSINKYGTVLLSNDVKEKVFKKLMELDINNKENRKKHIKSIKNNTSSNRAKIKENICPKCGGKLIIRSGKYGKFKACSNYPKCRFTNKIQ